MVSLARVAGMVSATGSNSVALVGEMVFTKIGAWNGVRPYEAWNGVRLECIRKWCS